MLDFDQLPSAAEPSGILPYLTGADPSLARNSGGRDPLGLQPIWSAFGRKLVPNIASPVHQVNGVKAVLLIHWLGDAPPVQKLLTTPGAERGFFRLMEGLVEYWLYAHGRPICFGSQSLAAGGERFAVGVETGKTVANGLYQYYRGTCRRARLLEDDWRVRDDLRAEFGKTWNAAAIGALAVAIPPCLSGAPLVPATLLTNRAVSAGLEKVFDSEEINGLLRAALFCGDLYRALARDFSCLRAQGEPERFGEKLARLAYAPLADELEHMRRCEPFLLVLQDVFDLLRAVPGRGVQSLTSELDPYLDVMRERATQFSTLAQYMPSGRMQQMQELAAALSPQSGHGGQECLSTFVRRLVEHHAGCMRERGREPMALIEGNTVVLPVAGERDPQGAKQRLREGYPWMNDYYLGTAATLYEQLHGEIA